MRTPLAVVVLLAVATPTLWPATGFEGKPVTEIRFQPKVQPIPVSSLTPSGRHSRRRHSGPEKGSWSMERLYATGRYTDIEWMPNPRDGVSITYITKMRGLSAAWMSPASPILPTASN